MKRTIATIGLILMLIPLAVLAANISATPQVPDPLQSTDRLPLGRPNSGAAYTASIDQINLYVQGQFSSAGKYQRKLPADPFARSNHTGSQAAGTITEDSTHRFATDAEKAAWTAKQNAMAAGVDYLAPAGSGAALTGLTKSQVGLSAADNTSDANKPVSTAQQSALDTKANLSGATFTGAITAPSINSTAADGQRYIQPYNSIAFAGTPAVGMIQTTPTGPQWYKPVDGWTSIGAGVSALSGLTDATITTPQTNDFLRYNGTSGKWENQSVSIGGGGGGLVNKLLGIQAQLSSGRNYMNTAAMAKHTMFPATGNQYSKFSNMTTVLLKPNNASTQFRNTMTGASTTAGYSIKVNRGQCEFSSFASNILDYWCTVGTAISQWAQEFLAIFGLDLTTTDHGSVTVGTESSHIARTLSNTGTASGNVTFAGFSSNFRLVGFNNTSTATTGGATVTGAATATLPASSSITFKTAFKPTAAVTSNDHVTVAGLVLGLTGLGVSSDPYTTMFSSNWDGTGAVDTGGTGTGVPWTTLSDSASKLSVVGNKLQVVTGTTSTAGLVRKTLATTAKDVRVAFDITTPSSINANGQIQFVEIRANNLATVLSTGFNFVGNTVHLAWKDGSDVWANASTAYTFAPNTTYAITVKVKQSTTTTAADGGYELMINGVSKLVNNAINTPYYNTIQNIDCGYLYSDGIGDNTFLLDNLVYGVR